MDDEQLKIFREERIYRGHTIIFSALIATAVITMLIKGDDLTAFLMFIIPGSLLLIYRAFLRNKIAKLKQRYEALR